MEFTIKMICVIKKKKLRLTFFPVDVKYVSERVCISLWETSELIAWKKVCKVAQKNSGYKDGRSELR